MIDHRHEMPALTDEDKKAVFAAALAVATRNPNDSSEKVALNFKAALAHPGKNTTAEGTKYISSVAENIVNHAKAYGIIGGDLINDTFTDID